MEFIAFMCGLTIGIGAMHFFILPEERRRAAGRGFHDGIHQGQMISRIIDIGNQCANEEEFHERMKKEGFIKNG